MEDLIRRYGGNPFLAPSVKELPFEQHSEVYRWAERLFAGDFDLLVLMTGCGTGYLRDMIAARYSRDLFAAALRKITIVSRGPKPVAVLKELGVTSNIIVPEPNTWRKIVPVIAARPERRIALQEYGQSDPEFVEALEKLGATVSPISIYRWVLPDDLNPLREAVRRIAKRECDVVLFTSSIQLSHLLQVAGVIGRAADVRQALAEDIVIASIGPAMNATLEGWGFTPDIVAAHPKMATLVRTAAEFAASVLLHKRRFLETDASRMDAPNFSTSDICE